MASRAVWKFRTAARLERYTNGAGDFGKLSSMSRPGAESCAQLRLMKRRCDDAFPSRCKTELHKVQACRMCVINLRSLTLQTSPVCFLKS